MSAFDFGAADAWETSTDDYLPKGSHICTIIEAQPAFTKGSFGKDPKPQIELKVQGDKGSRRDWIVITPNTVGKVVQLYDACGAPRPSEGDFNPTTGELTEACVARLRNRKVGVVVREEESLKDATKMELRIGGYVEPSRVSDDMPADTRGLSNGADSTAAPKEKDDIPF